MTRSDFNNEINDNTGNNNKTTQSLIMATIYDYVPCLIYIIRKQNTFWWRLNVLPDPNHVVSSEYTSTDDTYIKLAFYGSSYVSLSS